jgi:hypothetical protein
VDPDPRNLDTRVTALESQMRDLAGRLKTSEQDAAAARVLAGAADRDVSEFRSEFREFRQATTGSFNALREDFVDLRSHVEQGFTEMRGKLDGAAAGQQHIVELIQGIASRDE